VSGWCGEFVAERYEGDRVTTVKESLGQGPEGTGEGQQGQPGAGTPQPRGPRRWYLSLAPVTGLIRRHWLFSLALVAASLPRLVAILGFQPAMLFRLDTFDYLWGAVHLSPNVVNPSGYSLFLWLLHPFHSIVLIDVVQHILGLGVATMVYAVLRHYALPAWGATLAAAPVLFDPEQIMIEHLIMADLLAMVLMVGAFTVLLLRDKPSLWRSVTAAVLMGASTIVRPTVLPLVFLIPVYLLLKHVGWRRAGAALVAGLVPVLGYMGWFAAAHGTFNITNSNGLFLWSRTMSFANCSVIKPPANLQALCPDKQPGPLARADPAQRRQPKRYLWNHSTWAWQGTTGGFAPDTAAFTPANNERALQFAVKAIKAQPVAYASAIWAETLIPFIHTDNSLRFPAVPTSSRTLDKTDVRYAIRTIIAYTGTDQGVSQDIGFHFGTRLVHPYSNIMDEYQQILYLPGPVFGLIVLIGLVGIVIPSRRSLPAIFLWLSAVIIMVLPTAEHEYTYRYVIPAVPLVCIAAALALRKPARSPGNDATPAGAGAALAAATAGGAGPAGPAEPAAQPASAGPAGTPGPAGSAEPTASADPGAAEPVPPTGSTRNGEHGTAAASVPPPADGLRPADQAPATNGASAADGPRATDEGPATNGAPAAEGGPAEPAKDTGPQAG
jgi:hypothetical protein